MTAERQPLVDMLSREEAARLTELEGRIRPNLGTFQTVGAALMEIRDSRLYRQSDRTWGDYVERAWGFSRQRAAQYIGGAETAELLAPVGLTIQNEREARELRGAAQIVGALEPEMQHAVAQYLKTATGSERPTTSQVKAAAEVAQSIDLHATVAHPDTGTEVPYAALTGAQRAATLAENVSTGTTERLARQQVHIQESTLQAKSNGRGGWTDWCMDYPLTPDQELRITVAPDASGNNKATAAIWQGSTIIASAENASWLKKAVMNLVKEVKT